MKNIRNLVMATVALVSVSSMANLLQPHVAVKEDAPIRISAGAQGGLIISDKDKFGDKNGFGANNIGAGLGFTHNVGYDFEYGLAVSGGWAAWEGVRVTSKDESEKGRGFRLETELLARFMPELADSFRLGGVLGVGYSHLFGGEAYKPVNEMIKFGDLAVRVGIATSYGFSDMVSMYFAPTYALTEIRFLDDKADQKLKDVSTLSGLELPLGLWVEVADNVGLYLEANTRFRNFKKFTESWKEDVTLGVSFAI